MRAPFPVTAGGAGCTLLDAVDVIEAIAAASPSTALLAAMPIGLAGAHQVAVQFLKVKNRSPAGR